MKAILPGYIGEFGSAVDVEEVIATYIDIFQFTNLTYKLFRPVDNGAAGAAMAAPLFSQIKICNPLKLNV